MERIKAEQLLNKCIKRQAKVVIEKMDLFYWQENTSIGIITVVMANDNCCRVAFASEPLESIKTWLARVFPGCGLIKEKPITAPIFNQLEDYLAGNRKEFDLPLLFKGSSFQQNVWQKLLKVPYGDVVNYGFLAKETGSAPRAIGGAMGANPIAIIAPCHRVIGSDGSLTGFGGGLSVKKKLLEIENIIPREGESILSWLSRQRQGTRFLGNRKKKTYCQPDCSDLNRHDPRKNVPALFLTADVAEAKGYNPCPTCMK